MFKFIIRKAKTVPVEIVFHSIITLGISTIENLIFKSTCKNNTCKLVDNSYLSCQIRFLADLNIKIYNNSKLPQFLLVNSN